MYKISAFNQKSYFRSKMEGKIITPKPFQLIHFIQRDRKPQARPVDITLLKWIKYNILKKKIVTKYMPEPYTDERNIFLYDLIERQEEAPDDWPEYTIKIVGHAG